MLASLEALQSATAVIARHVDTMRWGVLLQFDNGTVWQSEDTFDTRDEAQTALNAWVDEIGGKQHQIN